MLIINPVSGKGQVRDTAFDILTELCAGAHCPVTVFMTARQGDATAFARMHGGEYDTVVCVGGDGTLSEVVSGLMHVPSPPPIGYIPMGTTNDMASTLRLPKNAGAAARSVMTGRTIPLDVGRLGENHFTYIAAFGAFTEVSYSTPQEKKRVLGHLAYILEALTHVPKLTSYRTKIEYDDGVIEGDFVFGAVTNSLSVAGVMKLDPASVALADGYFEVMLIRTPSSITALNAIATSVLSKDYDPAGVVFLHTKKVKFTFEKETAWTRDGESGGVFKEIEAENCCKAMRVIVPEGK